MIAISRGPGGPPIGGQQAPMPRAAVAPAASGADNRLDIVVKVAAENVAAKRTVAQLLSGDGPGATPRAKPGAELDREL